MNAIVWLEIELAYTGVIVQYASENPPRKEKYKSNLCLNLDQGNIYGSLRYMQ